MTEMYRIEWRSLIARTIELNNVEFFKLDLRLDADGFITVPKDVIEECHRRMEDQLEPAHVPFESFVATYGKKSYTWTQECTFSSTTSRERPVDSETKD
jgi:hypothetical protein